MVKKIPFFLLIIINVFVANIAFAYSEDIEAIGQEIGGGGGRLDWPVPTPPAVMTSAFGYRVHPITGNVRHHGGVDLAGDFGDPIYAAGDGVVEDASIGYNGGYGNLVIIPLMFTPVNRYIQGRLSQPWGQRELLLARTVTLEQS